MVSPRGDIHQLVDLESQLCPSTPQFHAFSQRVLRFCQPLVVALYSLRFIGAFQKHGWDIQKTQPSEVIPLAPIFMVDQQISIWFLCVYCAVTYWKQIDFYRFLDSYVALLEGNLDTLEITWNQFCWVMWGQFPDLQAPKLGFSVGSWGFENGDVHPDLFNDSCLKNNDPLYLCVCVYIYI